MEKLFLILIFFFIVLIQPIAANSVDLQNYLILQNAAVSVIVEANDDTGSLCSGIIISKTENFLGILTAKHCMVPNFKQIYINGISTKNYIVSKDLDVMYIELNINMSYRNPVKLALYNASNNNTIYFLGYPNLKEYFKTGLLKLSVGSTSYISSPAINGCSGAGVINERGELIGILWGTGKIFGIKYSMITPIEPIRIFLRKNKILTSL